MVGTACRNADNLTAKLLQHGVLALGIADKNVVVGIKRKLFHFVFRTKGLAGTRHAKAQRGTVHQFRFIDDNHIAADGVFAIVNSAVMEHFLHTERNKHSCALRGKRAERVYLPYAIGQHGFESLKLLIFERGKLTEPSAADGKQGFGIAIQFLFAVCGDDHGQDAGHHALISVGKVI